MQEALAQEIIQLKMDQYTDMLFRLSYVRLHNFQDAEDVVQETFYQYLRKSPVFESGEHEKAWLITVALNGCRKLGRSAWNRHRSAETIDDHTFCTEKQTIEPATYDTPETVMLQADLQDRILQAVMALPLKYRDVIHLFYYEELSVKQIAQITDRKESTVTSQLTRGRQLLKKALKEEFDFA